MAREVGVGQVRQKLLRWYRRHARDLPWRRTQDPYAIWVSEVMLQQTRVETVVPYYKRFLERFPSVQALAEAEEDAVLAQWSGLGYYRRARLLHRGVKDVVANYGGCIPRQREAREALPGVGPYTCGAIGSIAFGLQEPLVDGNVARVLARLHGIREPLEPAPARRRLWKHAEELVQGRSPGQLNQALMELGATVCAPSQPDCPPCPLRRDCLAHREGLVEVIPFFKRRAEPRRVQWCAVVAPVDRDSTSLWVHRGDGSLFQGLWSVPVIEGKGWASAKRALAELGLEGTVQRRPVGRLEHVLSHRRLMVTVYRAKQVRAHAAGSGRAQALSLLQLRARGTSSLTWKIIEMATEGAPEAAATKPRLHGIRGA